MLSLAAGFCFVSVAHIVVVILATTYHNHKVRKMADNAPDCCMCGASLDENGWCGDWSHTTVSARNWALDQLKPYGQPLK